MALPAKPNAAYGLPGIFNLGALTLNDNDSASLQLDANGNLKVNVVVGGSGSGGSVYNSTPPTYTNGQTTTNQSDANGNQKVNVVVAGVFNTSAPTYTNGQSVVAQYDTNGNLKVTLATNLKGEEAGINAIGWLRTNTNNPNRLTLQTSAAQTANNNSSQLSVGDYKELLAFLNVTTVTGTAPTLAVKLQTSDDGGTTWYDLPGATFTSATAATTQAIQVTNFGDTIRAVSTIGGTSPSFTYAVKVVGK